MKRHHEMPFGAECRDDGSVRFRLWAPAARSVELSLANHRLPLRQQDQGWYELATDAAGPSTQYFFVIDGKQQVPDPASRFQPHDVHGPSEVIDPRAFEWRDDNWQGRHWEDAVIYEAHVGTFTPSGTFCGVHEQLDYLADLGITALELMPVADFAGKRNWGYDGVLPFAPDSSYGRPEDLKALVQAAHDRKLMVLLDVVYNHFGPEGNYLRAYAPQFFTDRHHTPWGDAINFDGRDSRVVRDFFIHNALYWLNEFHLDGLRFDAVHAILDDSVPDILSELASMLGSSIPADRHVHLILENEKNQARYLERTKRCRPRSYTAQWNDDVHHALHVLMTGENDGYYSDYANRPISQLGRCLTEGFAYQGEVSAYRNGEQRGENSAGLPPTAFVSFLQNHDQIGNRAFGERITQIADSRAVRASMEILLLAPSPPLLFMGEEFAADTPFLYFCNFEKDLAAAVTEGRRNEFTQFKRFRDPAERERIPDPNSAATFQRSKLNWEDRSQPVHQEWLRFFQNLLRLRAKHIAPLLAEACVTEKKYQIHGEFALTTEWSFGDGSKLTLLGNLGNEELSGLKYPSTPALYASGNVSINDWPQGVLPPWSVAWFLQR